MLDKVLAHWPLKLLALALAFAIWVSITGESRVVQDFRVPLEFQLPDELVLASTPPTTVEVRLRGAESLMRRLDPVPMVMRLDLRDAPPGSQEVPLDREDLRGVPRGVDLEFIDPDRTQVVLEQRSRQDLVVEPTVLGQPADGFQFYSAQVNPNRLRVEGPESQVAKLEILRTTPIRLDGRSESFVARVGVAPEGDLVRVQGGTLEVRVVIDAAAVERRMEGIPVEIAGSGAGSTATPATLNVILSGPPRIIDRLTAQQVRVIADVSRVALDVSRTEVPVRVEFPDLDPNDRALISEKSLSRRRVTVSLSGRRGL